MTKRGEEAAVGGTNTRGDTPEDFRIFEILCGPQMTEQSTAEMTTTLKSELAALQYKRDSLLLQLQETKAQLRKKEEKAIQLESETEQLKEQAARQNVVIASLRKRIQELEERERSLAASQGRSEMSINTLQRENRHHEEQVSQLARKVSTLEIELNNEEKMRHQTQKELNDLVRQMESSLGMESSGGCYGHVVQESCRLKGRSDNLEMCLRRVEEELGTCRNALSRATADRDALQSQAAGYLVEIDRLKQEREKLLLEQRVFERDLVELREKLSAAQRELTNNAGDLQIQGATIRGLRDDLKQKEDRSLRLETELRHLLESIAILLSSPTRFVESTETRIKEKIRDLINEAKDKSMQVEELHEKNLTLRDQVGRLSEQRSEDVRRLKELQDDKLHVESRLRKTEVELSTCISTKESLRRDKAIFVTFLERLARALNMEDISREIGVDLHTESILLRAEQLSRLESDKLADKSAVVYQLQRRVRNLRDQLQRRDLHLDLLRRKLTIQEDSSRTKGLLQAERDEANLKVKKMSKQIDRLQVQLNEARSLSRDLKLQITESNDYKLTSLERGRKIEELQKRLAESEMLRSRCGRKLNVLKDQVRVSGESAHEIRAVGEGVASALREELSCLRIQFADVSAEKNTLSSLRSSLCSAVGLPSSCADYELVSAVSRAASALREVSKVSRRYDYDSAAATSGVAPLPYVPDIVDDIDSDINSIYNKRPLARALLP